MGLAWDVKVIDGTNVERFSAKDPSPLCVAVACRDWCLAYNRREERCAEERNWKYEHIVFTMQGHVAPKAAEVVSLLAAAVCQKESKDLNKVTAEILRSISGSIPSA